MVTLAAIVLLVGFASLYLLALRRARSLALLVSDLRTSERTFRRIGEQSLDAIIMIDANSNVTYWNPAAIQMFGYTAAEIIGRSVHKLLAAERYRERAVAGFDRFQATGEGEFLGKVYEVAALRKDGTEFPIELALSAMPSGNVRNALGIARDITERKLAAGQLNRRDLILESITRIALELMSTTAIDTAMPRLLGMIGEAVGADRVIVLENNTKPDGTLLVRMHSAWISPEYTAPFQPFDLAKNPEVAAVMGDLFRTVHRGAAFMGLARTIPGAAGVFLRSLNVRSILLAPIPSEEGIWGYLGFEDFHTEREWESAAGEGVRVLGEIIGAALGRVRYIEELADAKRIVESSSTVLFRLEGMVPMPMTYVSENVAVWGYKPAQFTDSPGFYESLIHPDDRARTNEWRVRVATGRMSTSSLEVRFRVADGSYRWFDDRISVVRDDSGAPRAIEGVLFDITERKTVEEKLNFSNTLLTAASENSPDGILVVDIDGKVFSTNERFLAMWKLPALAGTEDDNTLLHAVTAQLIDPAGFVEKIKYIYEHPDEDVHDEIELVDERVFSRHSSPLRDSAGGYLGRIWFFSDITDERRTQRELVKLARTDALTEIPNRATFVEHLDLAFAACRRGAVPFALLFLDLDLFKDVNDTLGHRVGDILLKQVAERLLGRLRKTDVVARFGGDEFAILQPDAVDISAAASLATEIRDALTQPYNIEGNQFRITASIGIAFYTPEVPDAAGVLEQADRALYLAKQEGKNRFRFYSLELDRLAHEVLSLSEELKSAIAHDELELHYQPQVDVATGVIVGVEALVRWNHPTRGELKAELFIPAAERSGAIVPLGKWVLNSACRQYRRWRDEGVAPPTIAVNLSGAQLKLSSDFPGDVAAALRKWGLASGDLEFEVSEAVLAASSSWHPDALQQLRDLGVGLTIDDFGSDYTSIGKVQAYGVKRFKIAPQFIDTMASDPANAAVVRTMIGLANQLGIELIAKNVETETQERFLLSITEAPEAQGHFYSKPLTADAMTALLRRHSPAVGDSRNVLSSPRQAVGEV